AETCAPREADESDQSQTNGGGVANDGFGESEQRPLNESHEPRHVDPALAGHEDRHAGQKTGEPCVGVPFVIERVDQVRIDRPEGAPHRQETPPVQTTASSQFYHLHVRLPESRRPFASARHRNPSDVERTADETRGEQVDLPLQPADAELPHHQADARALPALPYCRGRARAHDPNPSIGPAVAPSAARARLSATAP